MAWQRDRPRGVAYRLVRKSAAVLHFIAEPAPAGETVLARERELRGGQRELVRDRPQPAQRGRVAGLRGAVQFAGLAAQLIEVGAVGKLGHDVSS